MTPREREQVTEWMDGCGIGFAERKRISVRRERQLNVFLWCAWFVICGAAFYELVRW